MSKPFLVLIACVGLVACPAPEGPPTAENAGSDIPGAYLTQARGSITLGDQDARGRVQVAYIVYPDDRVVVTSLRGWLDDTDFVVPFLWWDAVREPLRCTAFTGITTATGELSGETVRIPAGAFRIGGVSYTERNKDFECEGDARSVTAQNPESLVFDHDPVGNRFGFSGVFTASHENNDFPVRIELNGDFVNRPPVVRISHGPPKSDRRMTEGCPDEKAIANHPDGLALRLLSRSTDPDGRGFQSSNRKAPRADLRGERWARLEDDGWEFLGAGRELPQVVFESDRSHVLALTVTDHSGSRARKICRFHVDRG